MTFAREVRAPQLEDGANGGTGLGSMDAAINEVTSLFHTQLQGFAVQGLDNSHMDARGKFDSQLVRYHQARLCQSMGNDTTSVTAARR